MIIQSYLWRTALFGIFITWISLVLLDSFFGYLNELGDTSPTTNYGTLQALTYIVYTIPRRLYDFFPTATLIGSLLGLGNLAANSELIAMRAAGLSIRKITIYILQLGIILSAAIFVMGEWGVPKSELAARTFKIEKQEARITVKGEAGLQIKEQNRIIEVGKILSEKELHDIAIRYIDKEKGGFTQFTYATKAVREDGGSWKLFNVEKHMISDDFIQYTSQKESLETSLVPDDRLHIATAEPEQLSTATLASFIENLEQNNLNTTRYELAFWSRFAAPLSTLVMLIVALPFIFGSQRHANAGQRIFIGILIGVLFYILSRALNNIGIVYGVSPILSAFLPLLIFLAAGLYSLKRIR